MARAIMLSIAAVAVIAVAIPAFAQGFGPGGGPGMMQWWWGAPAQTGGQPAPPALPIDQAITRARQYLGQYRNPDLVPSEIMEFANAFYVTVTEKATGKGAFALLVDRYSGNVRPEMGPPGMWNTKYGAHTGPFGGRRARGRGYGPGGAGPWMMGPGYGPGYGYGPGAAAPPQQAPQLDEAKARSALAAWASQAFPSAGIGKAVEFPGYFTFRLTRDGKSFALASVNSYSGWVWYAWQYGAVVREQAIR